MQSVKTCRFRFRCFKYTSSIVASLILRSKLHSCTVFSPNQSAQIYFNGNIYPNQPIICSKNKHFDSFIFAQLLCAFDFEIKASQLCISLPVWRWFSMESWFSLNFVSTKSIQMPLILPSPISKALSQDQSIESN